MIPHAPAQPKAHTAAERLIAAVKQLTSDEISHRIIASSHFPAHRESVHVICESLHDLARLREANTELVAELAELRQRLTSLGFTMPPSPALSKARAAQPGA